MGVGASSWLEWSSGGDGGPSVPDQELLDAQAPGRPVPALSRADRTEADNQLFLLRIGRVLPRDLEVCYALMVHWVDSVLDVRGAWNWYPSVPDQVLLDAQVPG